MLKNWIFGADQRDTHACRKLLKERREALAALQQPIKEAKLPIIVLVEGWGAAGKGSVIHSLIRELDPRFFKVRSVGMPTEEERRWPFLKRHFETIPEEGKILFLDSGWMDETVRERMRRDLSDQEYARRLESIRVFERQLAAGGYLLVKLFLHISEDTQSRRLEKLLEDKDTAWRVGENDRKQNKNYDAALEAFDEYLTATDFPFAPWKVIDGTDAVRSQLAAADWLYDQITAAIKSRPQVEQPPRAWPLEPIPLLSEVKLDKTMDEEDYRKALKRCRKKLADLHNELYRKQVPVVIAYEGWDAAGKGGAIRRLTAGTDARITRVIPISAPSDEELAHHYLWRFWRHIPRAGFITIYDRSWYGRVLVERVEKLTPKEDWARAYAEINHFEHQLTNNGNILLKFWLHISPEEQLRRFREREAIPWKRYKITDEDWRNRDKWPEYARAADEMFLRTSTEDAPWHVVPAENKKYARLMVLRIYRDALKRALR